MPQDPDARKQSIVDDLKQAGNAAFADQLDILWDLNADRPGITLRTLYTKLAAIDYLAGQKTEYHDYTLGGGTVSESKGQVPRNFDLLRQGVLKLIEKAEKRIAAGRPAQVGQLVTGAVYTNPAGFPDPNDRVYRGDPLKRRPRNPLFPPDV